MTEPINLQKHILVAVMGKTPQIVTETLYYLMVKSKPRVPISAVYIITTSEGVDAAERALSGPQGAIARLCVEYGIDPASVEFRPKEHIKTIRREDGSALDDIRTSCDSSLLASQLLGIVRELTKDESTALYCSIAGGRKTMSASLMLALTLYGRKHDRLTHVLVKEEFETNTKFFFPPKRNQQIAVRKDNEMIVANTRDAVIELADIPFVRLREFLGEQFKQLEINVEELIGIAQEEVDSIEPTTKKLIVDLPARQAKYGDEIIPISGKLLALLAYYADRKVNHCEEQERPICGDCRKCFQTASEIDRGRFLELYEQVRTKTPTSREFNVDESLFSDVVMSNHTRINQKLQPISSSLKIDSDKLYANTRYGLLLDKTRIEIKSPING